MSLVTRLAASRYVCRDDYALGKLLRQLLYWQQIHMLSAERRLYTKSDQHVMAVYLSEGARYKVGGTNVLVVRHLVNEHILSLIHI